jgi:hypothetical protein
VEKKALSFSTKRNDSSLNAKGLIVKSCLITIDIVYV